MSTKHCVSFGGQNDQVERAGRIFPTGYLHKMRESNPMLNRYLLLIGKAFSRKSFKFSLLKTVARMQCV